MRKFDTGKDDPHWRILFNTQFQNLQSLNAISTLWISGLSKLGLDMDRRPHADELTRAVSQYTGYTFIQTQQSIILPQIDWYRMIASFQMPLTCFVRTPEELSYCSEPDLFHDVMGHIPFLAEREYSETYQFLAKTYIEAHEKGRSELLKELDFIGGMIIELGLISEPSGIKAFGSTFYSSGEVFEAFNPQNQLKFRFDSLQSGESYDRHSFQGKYYIFDGVSELVGMIDQVSKRL